MQVPIDHHEAEVICSDMTLSAAATKFHETLAELGLAQCRIAQWFGVTARSVRRWQYGDRRIPAGVAIVIRLLAMKAVTTAEIEQVAVPTNQTNGCAPPIKLPREAAVPPTSLASPARTNGNAKPGPPAPLKEAPEQPVLARAKTAALAVCALTPGACRWPTGDPQHANFSFCNSPAIPQQSYCARHCGRAYLAPRPQQAPAGGQKPSSLAAWRRTSARGGTGRPSHDVDGPRTAPVVLSV